MDRAAPLLWRATRGTAAHMRPFSAAATASASPSSSPASSPAPAAAASWTLTLERGIGKSYGAEAELQATGAFAAEVFPDLPIATTWQNLAKAMRGGLAASASAGPAPPFPRYSTRPGALKVTTAAANLRSGADIEQRLLQAAGEEAERGGGQRAGALLCVSGSHPVRTLPLVARFLHSSLDTLRIAQRLKQQGHIPHDTQLWVVANPNTERGAALLELKASLGATAVLTQPPLDWPAYLAWLDDAERRGLLLAAPPPGRATASKASAAPPPLAPAGAASSPAAAATPPPPPTKPAGSPSGSGGGGGGGGGGGPLRLLVGHPVASSAANLTFWMSLSGCGGSAAARQLVTDAARAEVAGREAAVRHVQAYNRRLVEQVLSRGGVAGMHVMPITKGAKGMVLQMLEDGSLPRSA